MLSTSANLLLGRCIQRTNERVVHAATITLEAHPYIVAHTLEGGAGERFAVIPASLYIEAMHAAASSALPFRFFFEDVFFQKAVALEPSDVFQIETTVTFQGESLASCEVRGRFSERAAWTPLASCTAKLRAERHAAPVETDGATERAAAEHHATMRKRGYIYAPSISLLRVDDARATAVIALADQQPATPYEQHPVYFGACSDVALARLPADGELYVTLGMRAVHFHDRLPAQLRCRAVGGPSADPSLVVVELTIANDEGHVVAEVDGYQLKRVNRRELGTTILTRASEKDLASFYRTAWVEQSASPTSVPRRWLVLANDPASTLESTLIEQLGETFQLLVCPAGSCAQGIERIADFVRKEPSCGVLSIASLRAASLESQGAALPERVTNDVTRLLDDLRALAVQGLTSALSSFVVVTQGAFVLEPNDTQLDLGARSLSGFGIVVAREFPELSFKHVDLGSEVSDAGTALRAELRVSGVDEQVGYRAGKRYVPRLRGYSPPAGRPVPIRADGSYLVTGGLGGIGRELAARLLERGAGRVYLLSRRRPDEALLRGLREQGLGEERVVVLAGDVADPAGLRRSLDEVRSSGFPLRGVFHAAGVTEDGLIIHQDAVRLARVFAPKVFGGWYLHEATKNDDLDLFVLFSSVTSLLGRHGLSTYAAGNAFLDGLAELRHAEGRCAVSIQWGPWTTGMLAALDADARHAWEAAGYQLLMPASGMLALEAVANGSSSTVGAFAADWEQVAKSYLGTAPPLLSELAGAHIGVDASTLEFRKKFANEVTRPGRLKLLQARMRTHLGALLNIPPDIDVRRSFADMGTTSAAITALAARLQADLEVGFSPSEIFNYPNVQALCEHVLSSKLPKLREGGTGSASRTRSSTATESTKLQPPVQPVTADLSDNDVAALLAQELENLGLDG